MGFSGYKYYDIRKRKVDITKFQEAYPDYDFCQGIVTGRDHAQGNAIKTVLQDTTFWYGFIVAKVRPVTSDFKTMINAGQKGEPCEGLIDYCEAAEDKQHDDFFTKWKLSFYDTVIQRRK